MWSRMHYCGNFKIGNSTHHTTTQCITLNTCWPRVSGQQTRRRRRFRVLLGFIVRPDVLGIKPRDVQAFIPELLSNLHYESLIHGNATKEDAFKLTRIVQDNLGAKPLDLESFDGTRSLILPECISPLPSVPNCQQIPKSHWKRQCRIPRM